MDILEEAAAICQDCVRSVTVAQRVDWGAKEKTYQMELAHLVLLGRGLVVDTPDRSDLVNNPAVGYYFRCDQEYEQVQGQMGLTRCEETLLSYWKSGWKIGVSAILSTAVPASQSQTWRIANYDIRLGSLRIGAGWRCLGSLY